MQKVLVTLGCLMLAAGALTAVAAHQTSASDTSFGANLAPAPWRKGSGGSSGVSGTYSNVPVIMPLVGGTGGVWVQFGDIDGDGPNGITLPDGTVLFGAGFVSSAGGLCDMEVLSLAPGEPGTEVFDETFVDGTSNPGGGIPDGTFDDGGFGAACHVTTYGYAPYQTGGCSGSSFAEDWVSGGAVWIAAACDWLRVAGFDFANCMANVVINGLGDPATRTLQCVSDATGAPPGTISSCGSAGAADAANNGQGGTGVPYPAAICPATPGPAGPVANAEAATFVYSYVQTNGDINAAPGGWIDQ